MSVPIVRDSCFSTAVSATYLSKHKLVGESARFYFRSFSMGREGTIRKKENITCDVKLCVLADKENCPYARSDAKCPSEEPGYGYKTYGSLEETFDSVTLWDGKKILRRPGQKVLH